MKYKNLIRAITFHCICSSPSLFSLLRSCLNELRKLSWKLNWSTWHERGTKKNPESPTGIEPMTSRTPDGRPIGHLATKTHGEHDHLGCSYKMVALLVLTITTLKVSTHEGESPCPEEFTRRDWSQGLSRTVHTKRFEEQVAGTCPKNSNWFEFVGLVAGTKLVPTTRSWPKMARSRDGTCPRDLLQWLVAGTSPLVCVDLIDVVNRQQNQTQESNQNGPQKRNNLSSTLFRVTKKNYHTAEELH